MRIGRLTDREVDGWMTRCINRWIDGCVNRYMDGLIHKTHVSALYATMECVLFKPRYKNVNENIFVEK